MREYTGKHRQCTECKGKAQWTTPEPFGDLCTNCKNNVFYSVRRYGPVKRINPR